MPGSSRRRVGKYYSVNESNFGRWDKRDADRGARAQGRLPDGMQPKNSRYIGSLVADFHRNLINGRHLPLSGRHQERRAASCACCTRPARWRSSRSRPRAPPPTGSTASWTSCRPACTSVRRWSSAPARTWASWPTPFGACRPTRVAAGPRPLQPRRLGKTAVHGPRRLDRDPGRDLGAPGRVPLHPRHLSRHVHRPALDHAPVRRLRHREETNAAFASCSPPGRRDSRPRSISRPRWATTPTIPWPGRSRPGRRRDRYGRRPGRALPGDPARPGLHLDDDQRHGGDPAAMYVVVGEEQGVAAGQAHRHGAERRAQGVHRPRHLHLSGRAVAPAGGRHLPLRGATRDELQSRSRSAATTCGRPARRRCRRSASRWPTRWSTCGVAVEAGLAVDELRAPALLFLRQPQRPVRGGGQVPRRAAALGPAGAGAVRCRRGHGAGSAFTPRPAASRSRPSSRSTTSCG